MTDKSDGDFQVTFQEDGLVRRVTSKKSQDGDDLDLIGSPDFSGDGVK